MLLVNFTSCLADYKIDITAGVEALCLAFHFSGGFQIRARGREKGTSIISTDYYLLKPRPLAV